MLKNSVAFIILTPTTCFIKLKNGITKTTYWIKIKPKSTGFQNDVFLTLFLKWIRAGQLVYLWIRKNVKQTTILVSNRDDDYNLNHSKCRRNHYQPFYHSFGKKHQRICFPRTFTHYEHFSMLWFIEIKNIRTRFTKNQMKLQKCRTRHVSPFKLRNL